MNLTAAVGKIKIVMRMYGRGVVARDPSELNRGWYIAVPGSAYHLHSDGGVKAGVVSVDGKAAFWPTFEEAQRFLLEWKDSLEEQVVEALNEANGVDTQ